MDGYEGSKFTLVDVTDEVTQTISRTISKYHEVRVYMIMIKNCIVINAIIGRGCFQSYRRVTK